MAASNTEIVNRALSKLGEMRVTSLDDDAKPARLAKSLYDIVLDSEVSANSWNFAKDRVMITAEAGQPAFGWNFSYALPAECLRVLVVGHWPQPVMADYINGDTSHYALEGHKILTNIGPTLNLQYLRRSKDPEFYPPTFVEALACRLAMEMCETLTGSNSKRELAMREYQLAISQAKRLNAISLPPMKIQDDTWMLAHEIGAF
jgi:hypothetical protein